MIELHGCIPAVALRCYIIHDTKRVKECHIFMQELNKYLYYRIVENYFWKKSDKKWQKIGFEVSTSIN